MVLCMTQSSAKIRIVDLNVSTNVVNIAPASVPRMATRWPAELRVVGDVQSTNRSIVNIE